MLFHSREVALGDISAGCRAVIEHRIRQQLKGEMHLATFVRQQGQRSSEAASSTRSTHGDAGRIDLWLMGEPGQSVVAVMERHWKGMFGREAVLDCCDNDPETLGEVTAHRVVLGRSTEHVAPAVNPKQSRQRPIASRRLVHAYRCRAESLHGDATLRHPGEEPGAHPNRPKRPRADGTTWQPPGRTLKIGMEGVVNHSRYRKARMPTAYFPSLFSSHAWLLRKATSGTTHRLCS